MTTMMNRRRFIQGAAAAGMTLAAPLGLAAQAAGQAAARGTLAPQG
ncbi:hypothetical protein AZ24_1655 [Bordetella bronchiseptica E013]|nr:twin-arginine translocation signal domain-containing protein [Bordetella bronchiseptica]KDC06816.1 hypothetical protein AZ24_1655 [Bordetella bronchiseptica E013]